MIILSNDHVTLKPRTTFDAPELTFDFPGLLIGIAEYDEGPTGCTVFSFPAGANTAIDVRGGSAGMTQQYEHSHAICLAGGSLLGLEAAGGVVAGIFAQHNYPPHRFPLVNGAIIYDYDLRDNTIYPDKALGRAAFEAARPGVFPVGARGAGRSASVGGVLVSGRAEPGGQGGAYQEIKGVKLAVFTVVNALGSIVDRAGKVVRGNRDDSTGERKNILADLKERIATDQPIQEVWGNTTLTVLVTNQNLQQRELVQLGRQAHTSMSRAIYPFHTLMDGDVFYTVTTGEVQSDKLSVTMLGMLASELAWDAVLSAVGS
jgi:L-aminopeptidase/D-esterase-like protein